MQTNIKQVQQKKKILFSTIQTANKGKKMNMITINIPENPKANSDERKNDDM